MKKKIKSYFSNKTIWITGASSGIGKAICESIDRHCNCTLILSGRNEAKLTEFSKTLTNTTILAPFDVSNKDQTHQAIQSQLDSETTPPIDIVILNAGNCIYVEPDTFNSDDHESLIKTNYLSIPYFIEKILPYFQNQNKGHIVTVSSLAALMGFPRSTAYSASKAASRIFTQCLQLDLVKTNISVTSVLPGFVKTPLTAKNDFEMISVVSAEFAASKILTDIAKKKLETCFPFWFSLIIKGISYLPSSLRHRIMKRTLN